MTEHTLLRFFLTGIYYMTLLIWTKCKMIENSNFSGNSAETGSILETLSFETKISSKCAVSEMRINNALFNGFKEAIMLQIDEKALINNCHYLPTNQKYFYFNFNEEYGHRFYKERIFRRVIKANYHLLVASDFEQMKNLTFFYYKSKKWNTNEAFVFYFIGSKITENHKEIEKFTFNVTALFITHFIMLFSEDNQNISSCKTVQLSKLSNCFKTITLTINDFCPENLNEFLSDEKSMNLSKDEAMQNYKQCSVLVRHSDYAPYSFLDPKTNNPMAGLGGIFTEYLFNVLKINYTAYYQAWCDWPGKTGIEFGKPDTENEFGIPVDPRILVCTQVEALGAYYSWNVLDFMFDDEITFIITKAPPIDTWKLFLFILEVQAWIFHLIVTIAVCLLHFKIRQSLGNDSEASNVSNSMLEIYSITLGQSILFKSSYFKQRVLIMAWLIYSFEFAILLQSRYTDLLSKSLYEKQIRTIEDIVDNDISIYTVNDFFNLQEAVIDNKPLKNQMVIFKMAQKYGAVTWTKLFRDEIIYKNPKQTNSYIKERIELQNVKKLFLNTDKNTMDIYFCTNYFIRYFISAPLATKGHIYTELLNHWIHKLHSAGISNFIRTSLDLTHDEETTSSPVSFSVLVLKDVTLPLYILSAGGIICSIILLVELVKN